MFKANQSKDVRHMNIFLNVRTLICLSTAFFSNEHIQHLSAFLSASSRISAPLGLVNPHQTASTHLGKDRCRRIGPGKNRKSPWHGFRMIQDAGAQDDAG